MGVPFMHNLIIYFDYRTAKSGTVVTVVLCWTLVTDVGASVLWMMVLGAEWKVCEVVLSGMGVKSH